MKRLLIALLFTGLAYAQKDGPAELPHRLMITSLASTPAPNDPKIVGPDDSLQNALKTAACGDNYQVDPDNESVVTAWPSLECDAQHWIIISSSGPLPPEGTRITPDAMLPTVIAGSSGIKGGKFVRLVGLEIKRKDAPGTVYNLLYPGKGAHDLILDRVFVHGSATDETVRGLYLDGGTKNVAVVDSDFRDFHCKAMGACGDAQAIAGGTNDATDSGNYLIQNSRLEASGENVMFGGGADTVCPTDITVQYNDLIKPDSWMPGPNFGGIKWIAKNLFELKNGCRVLFQGNYLYGSWGGYSQIGFAMLVGVKNQSGTQCPACMVTDVVIKNNLIAHTGVAMQIMVAPSGGGTAGYAKEQARVQIVNNQFSDLQFPNCYQCGKWLVQLSSDGAAPIPLHDVNLSNNTFSTTLGYLNGGGFISLGGATGPPSKQLYNITVNNNHTPAGPYPVYSIGGGQANCATVHMFQPDIITACWVGTSSFIGNVLTYTGKLPRGIPPNNSPVTAGADAAAISQALANRK